MIPTDRTNRISSKTITALFVACLISMSVYLAASKADAGFGFPLDDAWIHQTYARNLAVHFEWSYNPGEVSGGSTSPLWTILLAVGQAVRLGPYVWTYLLGYLGLFGLALLGETAARWYSPLRRTKIPWVGLLIAFEWHLVWAAGSGMETLAIALLFTLVIILMAMEKLSWFGLGLLAGVSVWLRPDGLTLLGPLFFTVILRGKEIREIARDAGKILVGFLIPFNPYAVFTKILTGAWWPNTFYAKQAEYAVLRDQPLLSRLVAEFRLPLVGVGALLLIGFIWFGFERVRRKDVAAIAGLIWWVGYIGLYAVRLPVTYQYGRYVMPAMPLFFIWGAIGLVELTRRMKRRLVLRAVGTAWVIATVLVAGIFWVRGAMAYANDVAIIETEMVEPAKWIAANTNPSVRVAAHDIGAMGYFGQREVIDLAGLISPEVIPFIRDENQIADFLDRKDVEYLVITFDWYPELAKQGELVHQSNGTYVPDVLLDQTRIYRWR